MSDKPRITIVHLDDWVDIYVGEKHLYGNHDMNGYELAHLLRDLGFEVTVLEHAGESE